MLGSALIFVSNPNCVETFSRGVAAYKTYILSTENGYSQNQSSSQRGEQAKHGNQESHSQSQNREQSHKNDRYKQKVSEPIRSHDPYTILGVSSNASQDEIISAYRKKAQQYHPDKVANLGSEFKELAETKMKEINSAYAELKRNFK